MLSYQRHWPRQDFWSFYKKRQRKEQEQEKYETTRNIIKKCDKPDIAIRTNRFSYNKSQLTNQIRSPKQKS